MSQLLGFDTTTVTTNEEVWSGQGTEKSPNWNADSGGAASAGAERLVIPLNGKCAEGKAITCLPHPARGLPLAGACGMIAQPK
jgi:hypothetical protein